MKLKGKMVDERGRKCRVRMHLEEIEEPVDPPPTEPDPEKTYHRRAFKMNGV